MTLAAASSILSEITAVPAMKLSLLIAWALGV